VGSEIPATTAVNFRQILSRARRDLYGFLKQNCGLVNDRNPCRCAKKTRGFIAKGWVNPDQPQFVDNRLIEIRKVAPDRYRELLDLERRHADIFRDQPLLTPRKQAALLQELLRKSGISASMGLEQ
jgi:hypothetical protein